MARIRAIDPTNLNTNFPPPALSGLHNTMILASAAAARESRWRGEEKKKRKGDQMVTLLRDIDDLWEGGVVADTTGNCLIPIVGGVEFRCGKNLVKLEIQHPNNIAQLKDCIFQLLAKAEKDGSPPVVIMILTGWGKIIKLIMRGY